MLQILLGFNAVLAFLLELVLFYSVGSYGFSIGKTSVSKWFFTLLFVLIAIGLWGIWAAPKSEYRLSSPLRYIFELLMFLMGAFFLYKLNHTNWAIGFGILAVISVAIAYSFKQ